MIKRHFVIGCLSIPAFLLAQDPQLPARPARPELLRLERQVFPAAGANRLDVDVALLSGGAPFTVGTRYRDKELVAADGLSDLRFYERGGREVPYLLVYPPADAPKWVEASVLPVARTDSTSGFEADLGDIENVDRLMVAALPTPFLKRVRLEGSGDRQHWTLLVDEGTLFDLPEERLQQTFLEFTPGAYRYLRFTWDDRNSGRVPAPRTVTARLVTSNSPAPTLRANIAFEKRSSEPRVSRYHLHLPGAHLPIVAIELSVASGNVLRQARVSEQSLAGSMVGPRGLGSSTLRRAQRGDVAAASLRIPIRQPTEAALDLVVDDGDNPPLEITAVTAIFAQLPYIYFETTSTDPLTARYGGERILAPRYDLEAERERVPSMQLASARWGEVREQTVATQAGSSPLPTVGAAIDVRAFRWQRSIRAGAEGLTVVPVDAAVLAHSRAFEDVRIGTSDGRQVPFVLERLDEPLTLDLGPVRKADSAVVAQSASRDTRSLYRVRLPYVGLPTARLVLTTSARVFQRPVSIEVQRPAGGSRRDPWLQTVTNATWSHSDPDTPAPALTIDIPTMNEADLVLAVNEGDNSALPIESMTLLLPSFRVRFVRGTTDPLTLYYGRADLERPSYDLALLAPRLMGAPATEIPLGEEKALESGKPSSLPMTVFWVILGAAVLAMLFLIARLVKKGGPDAEPTVAEAKQ